MANESEFTGLPVTVEPPSEERFDRKLRRVLSRIPFAEDVVAAFYCASDPATPNYVRTALFGAVAYFVLPADMIPDFLLGLGFTDDASVIAATIAAVGSHIRPKHRTKAKAKLNELSA